MSKRTCGQVLVLPSRCLVRPAAGDDSVICRNTCGQVLVLPSRRLVRPADDDDFVKLLHSLQNCDMDLKKNYFFLPP